MNNPAPAEAARPVESYTLSWGMWAVMRLAEDPSIKTVLDVGSGAGEHARFLRLFGKEVFTTDIHTEADFTGDFMTLDFGRQFDAVLCSHVIEHQRNVGLFLDRLISLVPEGGTIAVAVPCHPADRFVMGHLTAWSCILMIYNLVQAGLDCKEIKGLQDNECTLVLKKKSFDRAALVGGEWQAQSGQAQEGISLPWHDDVKHLEALFPKIRNVNPAGGVSFMANWDSQFTFPIPVREVDIEITTRKSPGPISISYESFSEKIALVSSPA